jgi:type IV secretory pathway VirB10-like protein
LPESDAEIGSNHSETPSPAPPTDADDTLSLADHEAKYGENRHTQAEPQTPPVETPPAEPDAPNADAGTPEIAERDEHGRFKPRKHRAASHDATPQDLPRIQNLTARLRAAEAERDALRAQSTPSVPRDTPASAVQAPPKPTADSFQDFGEYIEALTEWKTDQKLAAAEAKRAEAERQRAAQAEQHQLETTWRERWHAAKATYPDFEEVAGADTLIPQGSLIDAWIIQHKAGPHVLYHLQKHPDELSDLLSRPLFEQAEGLALLSQRVNGHSPRTPAAATGSAAAPPPTPAPRPPNPVRTGPIRAGDEPPGDEASLADHERFYVQRGRRR